MNDESDTHSVENPFDKAIEKIKEIDQTLRVTDTSRDNSRSRTDVLADIDSHLSDAAESGGASGRIPRDETIGVSTLNDIESNLKEVRNLLDEYEEQKGLTDTVREAAQRFTAGSPKEESGWEAVTFFEKVLSIRLASQTRRQGVNVTSLPGIEFSPESITQTDVERWHDQADQAHENRNQLAEAEDTYRTLDSDYPDYKASLERIGVDPPSTHAGYIVHQQGELAAFESTLAVFEHAMRGAGYMYEGHLAVSENNWSEATAAYDRAHDKFATSFATYTDSKDDIRIVVSVVADSQDLQALETIFEHMDSKVPELLSLIEDLSQACADTEAGADERTPERYDEVTQQLEELGLTDLDLGKHSPEN